MQADKNHPYYAETARLKFHISDVLAAGFGLTISDLDAPPVRPDGTKLPLRADAFDGITNLVEYMTGEKINFDSGFDSPKLLKLLDVVEASVKAQHPFVAKIPKPSFTLAADKQAAIKQFVADQAKLVGAEYFEIKSLKDLALERILNPPPRRAILAPETAKFRKKTP